MNKIAVFASGSGSNAENIVNYFKNHKNIHVECILTNKADAYVLKRAESLNIESLVFNREDFYKSEKVLDYLNSKEIDFIVLAGFLWLVPQNLIKKYPNKIINIHPALLPKYGGKGMYGMNVHKAVVESGDNESGISIHYVNENYDEGDIVFQAKCTVNKFDTPENVAEKVHELEYKYFPEIIQKVVLDLK